MTAHTFHRDRAERASIAIDAFRQKGGSEDLHETVHDLIADLGHYCDQHHLGFRDLLRRAIATWAYEQTDPADIDQPLAVRVAISRRAA